jgi:heme/copper-type cytochrome/quinol oxidase subunit 1
MIYFASLQDTFFIVAIIYMVFMMLVVIGTIAAVFIIKSKIQKKIRKATLMPRRAFAFWSAFAKGMKYYK